MGTNNDGILDLYAHYLQGRTLTNVDNDIVATGEIERKCATCEHVYPLDDKHYYKLKSGPGGRHRSCIICCKVSRALEAVRKRDKKNKLSVRQRVRATSLGVECDHELVLVEVFRKARGVCYLCGKWVTPGDASMDHRLALVNGGTHTYDNVFLTHLTCNLKKGAKFVI